jgi:hypothetical protein
VVEKLIVLNTELMDKANEERAGRDPAHWRFKEAQAAAGAGAGAGGEAGGIHVNGNGVGRPGPGLPPPSPGPGPYAAVTVGVSIPASSPHGGAAAGAYDDDGYIAVADEQQQKPGWGKKLGKAWDFLSGDAPPVTPHINSALNRNGMSPV